MDITLSAVSLAVMAIPMAIIAAAIRLGTGPPIFFSQDRPGLGGRSFRLHKFRTMRNARDRGTQVDDASRIGALGRFLRRSSLDELPELLSVLKGDMSLVGPRPLLPRYLPRYTAEQARRHDVRPGITGWAQVNGRNAITWAEKFDLDVWYVDNWSLGLDLKIIGMTLGQVVRGKGVSAEGHATMPEFMGNEEGSIR